ncbi:MAG: DUF2520 domain-containing protein [Saprospiraceae bacterium]|nr:DUF2520 domain-containing protein [Saprospiraceae bacterium]
MIRNVGIIGAGRVGTALCRSISSHNFKVALHNRSYKTGRAVALETGVPYVDDLKSCVSQADLLILAVSDDAIAEVSRSVAHFSEDCIVVHTSGTKPISILDPCKKHGLLYPLDSFGYDGDHDLSNTPIFVEGSSPGVHQEIESFARKLTSEIHYLDSRKRVWLHVAAVMANNFTNAILQRALKLLDQNDIPRTALHKLLDTTLNKAVESPENSQTGPAVRGDIKTVLDHLQHLEDPQLKALYRQMSKLINPDLEI